MKRKTSTPQQSAPLAARVPLVLYTVAGLLSLLGLADAIYLTVKHLTGGDVQCIAGADCGKVLGSAYATIAGIPTAAFGVCGYFVSFSLATLAAFGSRKAAMCFTLVVIAMLAATLWLVYLQRFVLHAFCTYCLVSAWITLGLTIIASVSLLRGDKEPQRNNQ
jgi:uncharacterized membrane protein